MQTHDRRYKRFFSNPVIFAELVKRFVHEDFVEKIDFSTLKAVDKEFIDRNIKSESDLLYSVRFHGKKVFLLNSSLIFNII